MNRFVATAIVLPVAALGGFYAWARLRSEMGGADASELAVKEAPERHLVPERRFVASEAMIERKAPNFEAMGTDGTFHGLEESCRNGPVVLTFVKDGCPCSEAAQPFFNRLRTAYPHAEFFGVIDAPKETAKRWASKFHIAYPVLLDPGCGIIQAYHVENSAYVVLVDAKGRILKHWPGYSSGTLRELGATLATLMGTPEQPIDVADAPGEPYSGCPFDL